MNVVAIVVTYNGAQFIDKCFGSIRKSNIPVHIIAIDNASTDGTVEKLKNDYPEVELIVNKKNIGFGRANNIGFRKALEKKAEYVLLLNQDAWIQPDVIKGLVEIQNKNPEFDILSPVHLSKDNEVDKNFIISLNQRIISDLILGNQTKQIYEVDAVHAAFWLMTNKSIETVGGFDPLFFYRGEDNDYIARCKIKHIKFGINLNYFIYHEGEINRSKKHTIDQLIYRKYIEYLVVLKTKYDKKLWRVFRRVFVQFTGEIVKALLNLNGQLVYINSAVLLKLLISLPQINKSRTISLSQKKAFL